MQQFNGHEILGRLSAILYLGDRFYDFLLPSCRQNLFQKGSTINEKNLLQRGANSFLFKVDPLLEGRQNNLDRFASPENE